MLTGRIRSTGYWLQQAGTHLFFFIHSACPSLPGFPVLSIEIPCLSALCLDSLWEALQDRAEPGPYAVESLGNGHQFPLPVGWQYLLRQKDVLGFYRIKVQRLGLLSLLLRVKMTGNACPFVVRPSDDPRPWGNLSVIKHKRNQKRLTIMRNSAADTA